MRPTSREASTSPGPATTISRLTRTSSSVAWPFWRPDPTSSSPTRRHTSWTMTRTCSEGGQRFTVSADSPNRRFWEQLIVRGGQNFYGMLRVSTLHSIGRHGTTPGQRVMFGGAEPARQVRCGTGHSFYWRRHSGQTEPGSGYGAGHGPEVERVTSHPYHRLIDVAAFDPRSPPAWRRSTPLVFGICRGIRRRDPADAAELAERARCYARLARWMSATFRDSPFADPGPGCGAPAVEGIELTAMPRFRWCLRAASSEADRADIGGDGAERPVRAIRASRISRRALATTATAPDQGGDERAPRPPRGAHRRRSLRRRRGRR